MLTIVYYYVWCFRVCRFNIVLWIIFRFKECIGIITFQRHSIIIWVLFHQLRGRRLFIETWIPQLLISLYYLYKIKEQSYLRLNLKTMNFTDHVMCALFFVLHWRWCLSSLDLYWLLQSHIAALSYLVVSLVTIYIEIIGTYSC